MTRAPKITTEQLIEEMLEFGVSLAAAEIVAPRLAPLINDPRGLAEALKESEPLIALHLGLLCRN